MVDLMEFNDHHNPRANSRGLRGGGGGQGNNSHGRDGQKLGHGSRTMNPHRASPAGFQRTVPSSRRGRGRGHRSGYMPPLPRGPRPGRNGQALRVEPKPEITSEVGHDNPAIAVSCNSYTMELRVKVSAIPGDWNTLDIYEYFSAEGEIIRIDIQKTTRSATIAFCPVPAVPILNRVYILDKNRDPHTFNCETAQVPPNYVNSPVAGRHYPSRMALPLQEVGFGVERVPGEVLLVYRTSAAAALTSDSCFTLDLPKRALWVSFKLTKTEHGGKADRRFKLRFDLARVKKIYYNAPAASDYHFDWASLTFTIDHPPAVFERMQDVASTHDAGSARWNQQSLWVRQTTADKDPTVQDSPVELRPSKSCIVDFGRCLTYHLRIAGEEIKTPMYQAFVQALADNNVDVITRDVIKATRVPDPAWLWTWMDRWDEKIDALNGHAKPLPFPIHYQLEVCLSLGILHESNLTEDFLRHLVNEEAPDVLRILESAADNKERFWEPFDIFGKKIPKFPIKPLKTCARIPAATVTPCTVYLSTPVPETSNRVIRKFKRFEDRFLRVRFMDEKPLGRLYSGQANDALFERVTRAMTRGIMIAGRLYEFLAFGNSQIRDHGAYFFASTRECTADDIRQWMGKFEDINIIAKYASRLGQCFSTTHAIPLTYRIEPIPDVTRNGFCFTDGVGKISEFLAKMIAVYYGVAAGEPPSVYQFRLAGCKGILTVDPNLPPELIQMRPSQEKFKAEYGGLEIIKMSKFAAAHLNQQLVLVLSALGVNDETFLRKLQIAMRDIELATEDAEHASTLLRRTVDQNQMTLILAHMAEDGFMDTREPFTMSCLRLWRSWSLKLLREKARIHINKGAHILGTIDETATLRGHTESAVRHDTDTRIRPMRPQIFLQVTDGDSPTGYSIIKGPCILARNPSLHPGDIRIVEATDVPTLHHLRDCVVLPQTGTRDLASMCSGGDLDGDDYIVIWDRDLLPVIENHSPMDYTPAAPLKSDGPVTAGDLAKFFVSYMQNDNLGPIATSHRYWADFLPEGANHNNCIELAQLHSKAVDYVKTGVPALLPNELRPTNRPHWAGTTRTNYRSTEILGRLHDMVDHVPYTAGDEVDFDHRILDACEHDQRMDLDARELKYSYDEALGRVMAQFEIQNEAEIFTTLVLEHSDGFNKYKFVEVIGEAVRNLREQFQAMCYERMGTTADSRDWEKVKPFLVAMYAVTAQEVRNTRIMARLNSANGSEPPAAAKMSFPWIFARELGRIANGRDRDELVDTAICELPRSAMRVEATAPDLPPWSDMINTVPVPEIMTGNVAVPLVEGEQLDIFLGMNDSTVPQDEQPGAPGQNLHSDGDLDMSDVQAEEDLEMNDPQFKDDLMMDDRTVGEDLEMGDDEVGQGSETNEASKVVE